MVKADSKTVLTLQTCRELGMIRILNELKSKEDNKKEKDGTSMERVDIEKKVQMIAGKSEKELKQTIMKMYPNLFKSLGKMEPEYHINMRKVISPKVHPPRKIPASLQEKIKEELDNIEKTVVIRKIDQSTEWVNSMVLVEKPSGGLRICLDPRDLNKSIKREYYQLLTFEEITSRLSGAKLLTKLDAKKGYWQIPLDKESIRLTTFNTPFGRYQSTRLPYGVHSAQEVFHKRINQSFDGISQVETNIDDMLIWAHSDEDHNICLMITRCSEKAQKVGMTLNVEKCKCKETELIYLGHKLIVNDKELDENKIKSTLEMPKPEDKEDVQRLLRLINYARKFIPNLSQLTAPLRELLVKNKSWQWGKSQNQSFERIIELLVSKKCLAYYDVQKPAKIQVDASRSGIGAVLLQMTDQLHPHQSL